MFKEEPSRKLTLILFTSILLIAGYFRFIKINWDENGHNHPDERFVTMVAADIGYPESIGEFFDTGRSKMNPGTTRHKFFVYGLFPVVKVKLLGDLFGYQGYGRVFLVGRFLSAFYDLIIVGLIFFLARQFGFTRSQSLITSFLYACQVILIQNSHYYTVDIPAHFYMMWGLFFGTLFFKKRGFRYYYLALFFIALAVSCKLNSLAIAAMFIPMAIFFSFIHSRKPIKSLIHGAGGLLIFYASVRIFFPYAFAAHSWFELDRQFLSNIENLRNISRADGFFPPSVQWFGVPPWFQILQCFKYGAGPFITLLSFVGVGLWFEKIFKQSGWKSFLSENISFLWILGFFLGIFAIGFTHPPKYFRYLIPVYPLFCLFTVACLREVSKSKMRRVLIAIVCLYSFGHAWAFTEIYRRPFNRVTASRWIYDNIPKGSKLGVEHWDDSLPVSLPGNPSNIYQYVTLEVTHKDSRSKYERLLGAMSEIDYYMINTQRAYGSMVRRLRDFSLQTRLYEHLFKGNLGFKVVEVFTSYPTLFGIQFNDDFAEESLSVYDHAKIVIFKNVEKFSKEELTERLYRMHGEVREFADIIRLLPPHYEGNRL